MKAAFPRNTDRRTCLDGERGPLKIEDAGRTGGDVVLYVQASCSQGELGAPRDVRA